MLMAVQIARWQFTITDYARMRETGILAEDDRVELIDGEVRRMSPIGSRHVAIVNRLNTRITQQIGGAAIVSVQNPIQLTDYSEPQPDIALLQPRVDYYDSALPGPDDIVLVIEVADTSIDYDRDEKLPRYAAAGIAEVWLIDVDNRVLEQYTMPRHGQYGTKHTYEFDQTISSSVLPTLKLAIAEILA